MATHTLTLEIPDELYQDLEREAVSVHKTVEELLLQRVVSQLGPVAEMVQPKTPEELGWPPGFFELTAGSIPDFPDIDYEGDFEERDWTHYDCGDCPEP